MQRQYVMLGLTALVAFGGLVLVLLLASLGYQLNVMFAVFFCGAVGAVVNNYFRLAKISASKVSMELALANPAVTIQMWVSLLLSGILGFVAFGLFLSGIVQGPLFPKFSALEGGYANLTNFLGSVAPEKNHDVAKALVWAFVSGFSERFIPSVLDAIVDKAQAADGKPVVP